MPPDRIAHIIWLILAIMLVGSGLIARRLPRAKTASLIALWLGIIVAVWALVLVLQKLA